MSFQLDNQRGSTTEIRSTWIVETCCSCQIPFAMRKAHQDMLRRTSNSFFCPNGHPQSYRVTTEDQLRQKVKDAEEAVRRANHSQNLAWEEAAKAKKREQLAAGETRGLVTRIASGICPCCNRFFSNVERHMKSKHPGLTHKPFTMSDEEKRILTSHPTWNQSTAIRRRFVQCHYAMTDDTIAKLMIDGGLYSSPHIPTVSKAVANLRRGITGKEPA